MSDEVTQPFDSSDITIMLVIVNPDSRYEVLVDTSYGTAETILHMLPGEVFRLTPQGGVVFIKMKPPGTMEVRLTTVDYK